MKTLNEATRDLLHEGKLFMIMSSTNDITEFNGMAFTLWKTEDHGPKTYTLKNNDKWYANAQLNDTHIHIYSLKFGKVVFTDIPYTAIEVYEKISNVTMF